MMRSRPLPPDLPAIEFYLAWWWPLYMHGLVLFVLLTRMEPNWEKVKKFSERAVRVRVRRR